MSGTRVPKDDITRSKVRVDDLGSMGLQPVYVFVGVFEVIPAEAFLSESDDMSAHNCQRMEEMLLALDITYVL